MLHYANNNMCKYAEDYGLVRAKTATPRKRSKGRRKKCENLKRVKQEGNQRIS